MRRKGLAYLMTAVMAVSMLLGVPAASMKVEAATDPITVGDFKITGESLGDSDYSYDATSGIVTIKSSKTMTITSATKTNRTSLYIAKDVDANLVLKNIDMSLAYVPGKVGIEIADDSSGKVTLFLDGENSIITRDASAIQKNGSQGTLTISDYDSGSNQLFAYTSMKDVSECGATIGSAANKDCFNITINGGKVYVASSSSGAAIGGGCNGDGNNITISGGMVHACGTSLVTSGSINGGAAIGGGYCGDGNNITISGGTVHARFYDNGETVSDTFLKTKVKPQAGFNINGGAGIGGGYYGDGNNITISGGVLDVEGDTVANYASAAIGAGGAGNASNIKITGGQITAVGGTSTNVKDGAGIGTGGSLPTELGDIVDITISGGTIVAQGGATAPGIGAGDGKNAKVIITGGSINAIPGKTAYTNSKESITEKSDAIGLSAYSKACIDRSKYKRYVVRSADEIVGSASIATIQLKTPPFSLEPNTSVAGRLEFKLNGSDYSYNTTGMMTDSDGKVYVYVDPNVVITEKNADPQLIIKYNGSETLQNGYNKAVTITADGYTIATSQSGTYSSSYTFNTTASKTLYFKGNVSGKVTSKTISVKIDTTKPTGTISIDGKQYSTINTTQGTNKYKLSDTKVTISASDAQSTIESIQYGLSSSCYSTETDIESKISWSTYNNAFNIPANEAKAIYVKITDSMGNVKYLSTPIIYNDTVAPTNTITSSSATAKDATFSFSVSDVNSSDYAYVLLKASETAPVDWNSLVNKITTANGGKGTITSGSKTFSKTFSNLEANESYTFYLISKNTLKNLTGTTNENVSSVTKASVTTSKLSANVSNSEMQVKAGQAANSCTYDLKQMLTAAGLKIADFKELQYSCQTSNGSVISQSGQLSVNNGVVTIPIKANVKANLTQIINITFTSRNYETITATLTIRTIDEGKPEGVINLDGKQYTTINGVNETKQHKLSNTWVTITANDAESEVASIQYGIASSYYSTEANIESNVKWVQYNNGFEFPSNEARAIYVKIIDLAGNIRYLSTPIICHDAKAPVNTMISSSATTTSATFSFQVNDENASQYAYVLLKGNETAPNDWNSLVNKITSSNGEQGTISSGSKTISKTFSGLEANEEYVLYVISKNTLTDLAGNLKESMSGVMKTSVTTGRFHASVSNQELQVKANNSVTNHIYDLKDMLIAAGLKVSDFKELQYSCQTSSGSVINQSGQLSVNNGVVTIPVKANVAVNATQNIQVSFTSRNYETITATLTVRIIDKTLVTLSSDVSVSNATYDGTAHGYSGTVQWLENGTKRVDVNGTDITYEGVNGTTHSNPKNAPVNAGTYRVTFTVKSDNGNYTGTKSYTYTIYKASLKDEMSNVSWYLDGNTKINEDTYSLLKDDKVHTVSVKNYSPKVGVSYEGTSTSSSVGKHTVTAKFAVLDNYKNNYQLPADLASMTLNWTIADKIHPDMSQVAWVYQQGSDKETYTEGSTKLMENGQDYTVSIIGLPAGVKVAYSGTCTEKSAGNYTAKAIFTVTDTSKYYNPNPSEMSLSWSIKKEQENDDDENAGDNGGSNDEDINDDDNANKDDDIGGGNETGDSDDKDGNDTVDGDGTSGGDKDDISEGGNNDATTKVPSVGTTEEVGTNKYKVTTSSSSGGTVEYTAPVNKSTAKKVVIPTTVKIDGKTYKVTSIAKDAFSGCKKLTSVTIPNGITSIGANAFKKCTSLKTVKIPNSVTSIGSNAFNGCTKLTKVTIGTGVKTIGNGAFSGCSKLKTVSINANCKLTKIGDKAFYKCTSLTKITLPKNLTTIGKQAFFGCKKLKTITIKSKKLKKVGTKAIKGIYKKATIKCPGKTYVKKYKKLFKSKTGYAKTMKIK